MFITHVYHITPTNDQPNLSLKLKVYARDTLYFFLWAVYALKMERMWSKT